MEVNPLASRLFRAVVFDFDGTLADSRAAMERAYERWGAEFGVPTHRLADFLGMPNSDTARELIGDPSLREEAARRIEELEVSDAEGVVALPGSADALAVTGSRAAIGTSCTIDLLTARMRAAALPMPDVTVTFDQVSQGKPHPETFLTAASRLGADPAEVVVFEDARAGVQAARSAGMAVVGILTSHSAEELGADAHVPDLSHVTFDVTDDGIRLSFC